MNQKDAAKYILNILFHFIDINYLVLINNINFIKIKNELILIFCFYVNYFYYYCLFLYYHHSQEN